MMRYVLGDPDTEWVIGNIERKTEHCEREVPIEDWSAEVVGFQDGCIGLLLQEIVEPTYQGGIIYGSDGIIDLTEGGVRLLNSKKAEWEERKPEGEDPSIGQARELVSWIEEKTKHRGEAQNGREAVEIIMAIYESARLHEVVQMLVRTHTSPIEVMIENGDLPVERPGHYDIRAFLLRGESMQL